MSMFPPRYIPELSVLCAREIARECRKMTKSKRYQALKDVPPHLISLVKCFPTSFIGFLIHEGFFNIKPSKLFELWNSQKELGKELKYWFNESSLYGYREFLNETVPFRKCFRTHCENICRGPVIMSPYECRRGIFGLCKPCKTAPMAKLGPRVLLLKSIRDFKREEFFVWI